MCLLLKQNASTSCIIDFDPAHFATDAPPNILPQHHDGRISRLAAPRTSHYAADHVTSSKCSSCWDVEAFPSTHQGELPGFPKFA
ncbi:hypothetical protein FOZG_00229 [Fusarium oxysporum Fo47]|uniref:Uncharacterized protein n=1 Tax=Fusarium oxysporum Fo47 TaxID=660027 RepID=W9L4P9_FUSOX|nr:hypothetical protein FOZG_00229 [Fusarium oxysporum Fo47]